MMEPITRKDMFLANAAGQVNSDLPTPITREDYYLNEICGRFDSMERPTDEQVQAAVDNYLDENGIAFNTSAEITEVLNG